MKLLALDCAGLACSVALWRDGAIVAERTREMARGHAEALMPMLGEVMAAADERLDALDRLAVTVGPGSFTGIRVGLAAARGLALAIGCPLIGVGTLAALAELGKPAAGAAAIGGGAETEAVAGAPLTSAFTIRPLGPDPIILARSKP